MKPQNGMHESEFSPHFTLIEYILILKSSTNCIIKTTSQSIFWPLFKGGKK